jgi:hypothetical protein
MNRENSVCCWDLDSTLADTRHRFHLIEKIKAAGIPDDVRGWNEHSLACADDGPLEGAIALMRLLRPHHTQHIVSGRSNVARDLTLTWLINHDVPAARLTLRDPRDFTENGLIKVRYVRELEARGIRVVMFFEDYPPVAEQIHEMTGVPVTVLTPPYRGETHSRIENPAPDQNIAMGTQ